MPRTVSISVHFILRKNPAKPDAIYPIEAVIYKNTVGYRYAIGIGAKVSDWDETKDRFDIPPKLLAVDKRERTRLNDLLDSWEVNLKTIWHELNKPDFSGLPKDPLTPTAWVLAVDKKLGKGKAAVKIPTFTEHVKQEIEKEIKAWKQATGETNWRNGNNTLMAKFTFFKLILLYQKTNGKIEWGNINAQTVQAFQAWLFKPCSAEIKVKLADFEETKVQAKKAYNKTSANTHLIFFKGFLRSATLAKYLSAEALADTRLVRSESGKPDKFFYHWREVKQILEADLSQHVGVYRLHKCRILMCIGFFTGMREGDWPKFTKEFIHETEGRDYLNVTTDKKGTQVGIPLFGVLKKVLSVTGYQMPHFSSNSDLNLAMKELAKAAKINRLVMVNNSEGGIKHTPKPTPFHEITSSHDCRRTAGQMFLAFGLLMDTVRRLLGHRTETQTGEYVGDNTFASAEFNTESEREALKAFLNGDVDLTNFAMNHEIYLQKLAEMPVKPRKKA